MTLPNGTEAAQFLQTPYIDQNQPVLSDGDFSPNCVQRQRSMQEQTLRAELRCMPRECRRAGASVLIVKRC
jgi:hypothetical protein